MNVFEEEMGWLERFWTTRRSMKRSNRTLILERRCSFAKRSIHAHQSENALSGGPSAQFDIFEASRVVARCRLR